MKRLDISGIKLSKLDKKRGIKLPERPTLGLAEDLGIMVGDGNIGSFGGVGHNNYEVACTGHIITDCLYLGQHVRSLKLQLFGLLFDFSFRPSINTCKLRGYSKSLVRFYHEVIGLPLGSKRDIEVPRIILSSGREMKLGFLRGLADTDMTLVFKRTNREVLHYPVIKIGTVSKNLITGLNKILLESGFRPSVSYDMYRMHPKTKNPFVTHSLALNGKENLKKWVNKIGFNNPKNILRYNLWKTKGFSLPNKEIEKMLMGPEGFSAQLKAPASAACLNPRHRGFSQSIALAKSLVL